jgi:hypothetical protein
MKGYGATACITNIYASIVKFIFILFYFQVVSGFLNNLHSCGHLQFMAGITIGGPIWDPYANIHKGLSSYGVTASPMFSGAFDPPIATHLKRALLAYANCVRGCATNMILGRQCAYSEAYPTKTEIDSALDTLSSIGFIGITHRWLDTICLWVNMFPGNYTDLGR